MRHSCGSLLVSALLLLLASSCASLPRCETLYFGTATPTGVVSAEQWQQFVDEVVVREFPKGVSIWEADGRWRGADGTLVAERSHVVFVVGVEPAAIARVAAEYKRRFAQEAVMRVSSRCSTTF
jgi:hypothetical protein